jgi:hypothetical protein
LQGLQILDLEIPKTNFLRYRYFFIHLRLNGKMVIKSYERDSENNLDLIPQVITNDADLIFSSKVCSETWVTKNSTGTWAVLTHGD